MTYLATPADSPLYAEANGYIPNYLRVFALAPDAYAAWQQLSGSVRDGMDLHRYELVTLAAARRLGSDYCTLAHSKVLRDHFYDEESLRAIVADHRTAGLAPVDVAVMDFADLVAADPTAVTDQHAAPLRDHGLSDQDIFQIVLAVCIRRFFSGVLSAVTATPDPALLLPPLPR
ncbi:carboxymuconolactone decarboxylase family protein [Catellatospora sp. NPDC049609]|uniref:carboxymuconolactone decarboxylase family protein n=1 Tax=Catellatospora sp. NPDC049609 TaxID=3155505 RepID=UPI00342F603E